MQLPSIIDLYIPIEKSEKPKICMYLMLWYLLYVVVLLKVKQYFSQVKSFDVSKSGFKLTFYLLI